MLIEIRSRMFRAEAVRFHAGLNVVLGDANATNSIGKSTLLMVIDFAFGGKDLLRHNRDVVSELGHHDYFFSFKFDQDVYRFRRGTYEDDVQGLRMKNACEDLEHVLVVPCGYFSSSAQAVP
jgi:hypothetical protein